MKRSLVCVLSILALALSAPVMAQSEQSASGKVVSITSNQLVISTADGKQITFMMDNNTNRPSSLAQGSSVTVRYHDMSGTFHAANVAATGTSATSANAQDRGTTADPTGNDARNTRTTAQDVTGTTGTPETSATSTTAADQDTGTTRLPATASPLPLMGLSGLLALGGGLGVRFIRRRK